MAKTVETLIVDKARPKQTYLVLDSKTINDESKEPTSEDSFKLTMLSSVVQKA